MGIHDRDVYSGAASGPTHAPYSKRCARTIEDMTGIDEIPRLIGKTAVIEGRQLTIVEVLLDEQQVILEDAADRSDGMYVKRNPLFYNFIIKANA